MTLIAEKSPVARRFSKASQSYKNAANVQYQVGRNLLAYNPVQHAELTIDLGCGPGTFIPQLLNMSDQLMAVDLSADMLEQCALQSPSVITLQADAQQLPVPDNSVDLIYSSLALQWMPDMTAVFEEAHRVLKPNGSMVFSCVSEGSLWQLKKAWRKVDDFDHVNRFASKTQIEVAVTTARLHKTTGIIRPHTFWYSDIRNLFASIRDVGANTVLGSNRKGLMGRRMWQTFNRAYESYRTEEGLPLTYQIYYGVVTK
ncbi:malonyl-ACP O-methyltransferase BioC [Echinimonas agarilytica]|uniref:Malonyl-[acyl-carrier protein] O-methyltransferase n=1 Tax=Echinimonas agarilytica TaxID=1215918 RepID=A0AA41W7Y1_9GAMM|nr:malonyl-ACP O-methyltransferase BioC [Echinimonas agarilytica]MCM2680629.1 malonyl-ACP O-methyltransferase BioC [Echinimonas agarilytica]